MNLKNCDQFDEPKHLIKFDEPEIDEPEKIDKPEKIDESEIDEPEIL